MLGTLNNAHNNTGKPKGAVSTHKNIDKQTSVLVEAWYWTRNDRIHHILPLHHVHGIINALTCALYAGATVEMHQKFDSKGVWDRWLASSPVKSTENSSKQRDVAPPLTIFMSVPTVYCKLTANIVCMSSSAHDATYMLAKLISYYQSLSEEDKAAHSEACKQFRFMVSGSASLPTPIRDTWRRISCGQVLLERYGMTGKLIK